MVDDEGSLTGIIDWDNVYTVPRYLGYATYPGWITRDWDPLMYGYPDTETEDSPEKLETYRELYSEKMLEGLQDKGDWAFVQKSHVYEAVSLAASSEMIRLEIVRKLVDHVLGEDDEDDGMDVIDSVGEGDIDPELHSSVMDRLRSLIANPPGE